jgi:hypothetical protein
MRRRLLLALLVLFACAILVAWFYFRPGGINWVGYSRVRLGMSSQEVELVVGVPPGNHSSRLDWMIIDYWDGEWHMGEPGGGRKETWYSDDGCLRIEYDDDGRVKYKQWHQMVDHRPSVWQRLRARLGW